MPYTIEVQSAFSAAHALRLPNNTLEPLHGHDFRVTVRLACEHLDALETVLDFHDVEKALEAILAPWGNKNLNDLEPFATQLNPSAERIAETIGRALQQTLLTKHAPRVRLAEVRVTEAIGCLASWSPDMATGNAR